MKTKLTLRIEEGLIRRAKEKAKRRGTSVSKMVADYFSVLEEGPEDGQGSSSGSGLPAEYELSESTMEVAGALGSWEEPAEPEEAYRQHLISKYTPE